MLPLAISTDLANNFWGLQMLTLKSVDGRGQPYFASIYFCECLWCASIQPVLHVQMTSCLLSWLNSPSETGSNLKRTLLLEKRSASLGVEPLFRREVKQPVHIQDYSLDTVIYFHKNLKSGWQKHNCNYLFLYFQTGVLGWSSGAGKTFSAGMSY